MILSIYTFAVFCKRLFHAGLQDRAEIGLIFANPHEMGISFAAYANLSKNCEAVARMYCVLFLPEESILACSPLIRYILPVSGHQDTLASSKKNNLPRSWSLGTTMLGYSMGYPKRINCLSGTIKSTCSLVNCPFRENPASSLSAFA